MSTKTHIRRNGIRGVTNKFETHVEEVSRIIIWRVSVMVFPHQRRIIIFFIHSLKCKSKCLLLSLSLEGELIPEMGYRNAALVQIHPVLPYR